MAPSCDLPLNSDSTSPKRSMSAAMKRSACARMPPLKRPATARTGAITASCSGKASSTSAASSAERAAARRSSTGCGSLLPTSAIASESDDRKICGVLSADSRFWISLSASPS